ncbi:MAG TPA: hypothetical protein VFJ16_09450 [Longimicrobium sp.]|nr:hypothetical protein [Longimicrobium sp.]
MRAGWLAAAALAVGGLAACGDNAAQGAIPRDRFVKANVELRSVPDTAAAGDRMRAAALRRYRVSERDLQRFVRVHSRDPDYMAQVWREIADSAQRRFERAHPGPKPADLPPGMSAPDLNAATDSVLRPAAPRPAPPPAMPPPPPGMQPGQLPPGARRPPKPVQARPPVVAPPDSAPRTRTPSPPTDRRPITPPDPGLRPPPRP